MKTTQYFETADGRLLCRRPGDHFFTEGQNPHSRKPENRVYADYDGRPFGLDGRFVTKHVFTVDELLAEYPQFCAHEEYLRRDGRSPSSFRLVRTFPGWYGCAPHGFAWLTCHRHAGGGYAVTVNDGDDGYLEKRFELLSEATIAFDALKQLAPFWPYDLKHIGWATW